MAIIRPMNHEASGSIAGTTYSHNAGGQYIRQRRAPDNPNSGRQSAMRTALTTNSRAWNGLTNTQRQAWRNYATANPILNALGASIVINGIAMYIKLAQGILDQGGTPNPVPPSGIGPAALAAAAMTANTSNTATFSFATTPLTGGRRLQLWWTGAGRASQNPNFNQARLIGYSAANAATGVTFSLPADVATASVTNFFLRVVDAQGRSGAAFRVRATFA